MSEERKVWVGMDYLTASKVQDERYWETIVEIGKLLESTGEQTGWKHGYEGVEVCAGNGSVMARKYNDGHSGDVLVRLPGRALDWVRDRNLFSETEFNCTDADICRFFIENGFHATRIDLAMDTNDPEITQPMLKELIRAGMFTCRGRKVGSHDSWNADHPEQEGEAETLTIGSRSSSRYLRIYNKRAESLKRLGRDIGHCTRFELEHKGEAATRIMHRIARYGCDLVPAVMRGWVNFKDAKDDNPRMDRKADAVWWDRLVGGSTPVVLGLKRGATLPERSAKWLKHSVAKTLVLAQESGLMPEILKAMEEKRHKIKPAEWKLWQHFAECRKSGKTATGGEGKLGA